MSHIFYPQEVDKGLGASQVCTLSISLSWISDPRLEAFVKRSGWKLGPSTAKTIGQHCLCLAPAKERERQWGKAGGRQWKRKLPGTLSADNENRVMGGGRWGEELLGCTTIKGLICSTNAVYGFSLKSGGPHVLSPNPISLLLVPEATVLMNLWYFKLLEQVALSKTIRCLLSVYVVFRTYISGG